MQILRATKQIAIACVLQLNMDMCIGGNVLRKIKVEVCHFSRHSYDDSKQKIEK